MVPEIAHLGLQDEETIQLDVAALEIAALDHPEIDLAPYYDVLADLAEDLAALSASTSTALARAKALSNVVSGKHAFLGDRETYDNPANADLISVIDRRRGMPVSLSILYVGLARRIGWSAYALNTPGHVLVSVVEGDTVLLDPFNGGSLVDPDQLARLLTSALGSGVNSAAEHLAPMGNRAVLVRLLINQATRAERTGDHERALSIFRRITTVAPAYALGWWERSRLELTTHNVTAARASLSAMLETTRDHALRAHINAALDALGS